MTSRFQPSPEEHADILEQESEFKPICTVAVYRFQLHDDAIYTVNLRLERSTPELESDDYQRALEAIADSIQDIKAGRLKPHTIC